MKAQTGLDSEDLLAENVKRLVRAVAENRLAPEPDEFTPYAFTVIRTPQAQQLQKPTEPHCKRSVNEDTALKNTICRGNTEQVNFIWNREPTSMLYIGGTISMLAHARNRHDAAKENCCWNMEPTRPRN
ncbi:hypothetical protein [Akkermansia sp.]|uniref:hypothetical protein n=1 Tax=Akkermansia sp. TaxID=1872421 RepID=UPI003AF6B837